MAKQFPALTPELKDFIGRQHIFFTASATADSRINLSPKGLGGFRITGDNEAVFLNLTGSGNETAAHMLADGRLTIMFCAFEGKEPAGARQIVIQEIDLVQTSCGFGVPLHDYKEERPSLVRWAEAKGEDGIAEYWREKNMVSMDGLTTGMD
ncbi:MAG: pyridoxamine 5'-phosphate oxidase family protein [Parvibaculum sp.]|nr:pyridoxamine 5'-phosphate oxidase family protein [Parvibaculum sp.]